MAAAPRRSAGRFPSSAAVRVSWGAAGAGDDACRTLHACSAAAPGAAALLGCARGARAAAVAVAVHMMRLVGVDSRFWAVPTRAPQRQPKGVRACVTQHTAAAPLLSPPARSCSHAAAGARASRVARPGLPPGALPPLRARLPRRRAAALARPRAGRGRRHRRRGRHAGAAQPRLRRHLLRALPRARRYHRNRAPTLARGRRSAARHRRLRGGRLHRRRRRHRHADSPRAGRHAAGAAALQR
jgi:hypothetical protein